MSDLIPLKHAVGPEIEFYKIKMTGREEKYGTCARSQRGGAVSKSKLISGVNLMLFFLGSVKGNAVSGALVRKGTLQIGKC